jgi:hypothetical protein
MCDPSDGSAQRKKVETGFRRKFENLGHDRQGQIHRGDLFQERCGLKDGVPNWPHPIGIEFAEEPEEEFGPGIALRV